MGETPGVQGHLGSPSKMLFQKTQISYRESLVQLYKMLWQSSRCLKATYFWGTFAISFLLRVVKLIRVKKLLGLKVIQDDLIKCLSSMLLTIVYPDRFAGDRLRARQGLELLLIITCNTKGQRIITMPLLKT